jgi:hypothetical protein
MSNTWLLGELPLYYQGQKFFVVSKNDLVNSKKAAGRAIDLEDIRLLTLDDIE